MPRVSSVRSRWYSLDRGGVFASPTPQTAELVAELFATERNCFHPFQLQFIGAFEGVFVFGQPGRVVEVGHIQRAITYILIDCSIRCQNFQPSPYAVIASGRSIADEGAGRRRLMTNRSPCQTDAMSVAAISTTVFRWPS
jgi:hypothetical protein